MPQFFLSQPAIRDIEDIADFIASQQSLQQAEEFLAKLDDKFARMIQFPNLGRPRDEILPGMRSLAVDSYLIFYAVTASDIEILRVVSGYRDINALFAEDT
jgi:toxin ParE1/3/4